MVYAAFNASIARKPPPSYKGPSSLTLNITMSKMAKCIATMPCNNIFPTWVRILTLVKYFFDFFWMCWGHCSPILILKKLFWGIFGQRTICGLYLALTDFDPKNHFWKYFGSGKWFLEFILLHLLFLTWINAKIMILELLTAIFW